MSHTSDKFLCFLLGASTGGILALLYAPKAGRETRGDISRRAAEGREFITKKVDEGRHYVEDTGRHLTTEVTSLVDRGKSGVSDAVEKGRGAVKKQKEQFTAAFEAGKDAYLQDRKSED
jgi:gas vesicle protein